VRERCGVERFGGHIQGTQTKQRETSPVAELDSDKSDRALPLDSSRPHKDLVHTNPWTFSPCLENPISTRPIQMDSQLKMTIGYEQALARTYVVLRRFEQVIAADPWTKLMVRLSYPK
jgi:hypothetical protein